MRISDRYGFVFLANTQCASSAVRKALDPYSDYAPGTKASVDAGLELFDHWPASKMDVLLAPLGKRLSDYFSFTTVRNPWDRIVSRYHYGLKNPKSKWRAKVEQAGSFKAFACDASLHWATTFDVYAMEGDRMLVDAVARVEALQDDLEPIAQRLGLPPLTLARVNENPRGGARDYRTYYDDESAQAVADQFAKDIALFGYRF